jgi:hypothetical protein
MFYAKSRNIHTCLGPKAGTCDCGNEPSGSIKCGEYLDQLRTGQLLKKDSAPCSKYRLLVMLSSPSQIFNRTELQ